MTVYNPPSKVANYLRTPQDIIPLQIPGVYKADCSYSSSNIGQTTRTIGQTTRTIADRVKEHIAAVKIPTNKQFCSCGVFTGVWTKPFGLNYIS